MLKKVIISRGRWDTITTHKLLIDYCIVVPDTELANYKNKIPTAEFYTIPDNLIGLGKVRNYVIDLFSDFDVVMLDDDIDSFVNLTHKSPLRITNKEDIESMILNVYELCLDHGSKLFGFSQKADVRKYNASQPFYFSNTYVGGIVGVIRNELRFTEVNKFKVDVDYTLKHLLLYRTIFICNMYSISQIRDTNVGVAVLSGVEKM